MIRNECLDAAIDRLAELEREMGRLRRELDAVRVYGLCPEAIEVMLESTPRVVALANRLDEQIRGENWGDSGIPTRAGHQRQDVSVLELVTRAEAAGAWIKATMDVLETTDSVVDAEHELCVAAHVMDRLGIPGDAVRHAMNWSLANHTSYRNSRVADRIVEDVLASVREVMAVGEEVASS